MRLLMTTLTIAVFLGALPVPVRAGPVHVCARATVVMPSAEAHLAWLEKDMRYGPDDAAAFADKVKRFGPRVLDTQIFVAEQMSASAWFDLEGYAGIREAKARVVRKLSCEEDRFYPLVALIGMTARSMSRGALFVTRRPGTYEIVSIKGHPEGKPFALHLAGSRELLCRDIRDCGGLAAHRHFKR